MAGNNGKGTVDAKMTPAENKVGIALRDCDPNPYGDVEELAALVRDASAASPFRDIIRPGDTVLLKPNWVLHRNYSGQGNDCLVTHPNLIEAVLREVLEARPARVLIGDAPVQACDFDALVPHAWRERLKKIAGCPLEIIDFRRTVLREGGFSAGQSRDLREEDRYVLFDLATDSLLEPVSDNESRFRITCYDPDLLARRHHLGRHQYLLAKEPFEADVVINLPKLKCHKKAGMTGALKNIVGLNGNKEFLPHHRLGGHGDGGDCYPGKSVLKSWAERCYDEANRGIGTPMCERWRKRSSQLIRLQALVGNPEIEGSWHGNDTVWRMTLDLNRLLLYGRPDGTLSETPVRRLYSLTDGIVAGEGEGPLAPCPIPLGLVTFAASSPFADLVGASLMRFDWRKIPTLRESFGAFRYPLTQLDPASCRVVLNGEEMSPEEAGQRYGRVFTAPTGWRGHVEREESSR